MSSVIWTHDLQELEAILVRCDTNFASACVCVWIFSIRALIAVPDFRIRTDTCNTRNRKKHTIWSVNWRLFPWKETSLAASEHQKNREKMPNSKRFPMLCALSVIHQNFDLSPTFFFSKSETWWIVCHTVTKKECDDAALFWVNGEQKVNSPSECCCHWCPTPDDSGGCPDTWSFADCGVVSCWEVASDVKTRQDCELRFDDEEWDEEWEDTPASSLLSLWISASHRVSARFSLSFSSLCLCTSCQQGKQLM